MQTRTLTLITCLILSACSLSIGYILAGYWLIFVLFPLMAVVWIYSYHRAVSWASSSLMIIHIILSAIGIIAGFSTTLMIISGTTALAWWDLLQFNQSKTENSSAEPGRLLDKYHLKSLGTTIAVGLILALISANMNLRLPFGVSVILILMATGGLIFGIQHIVNAKG